MEIRNSVNLIITNEENKILLVRRSDNKEVEQGMWSIPGGRVEKNEAFEDALLREIREELGVDILEYAYFKSYFIGGLDPIIAVYFHGKINSNTIIINHEASSYSWFKEKDIHSLTLAFNQTQVLTDFLHFKRQLGTRTKMNIGFAILLEDECHNYARKLELALCEKLGLCWGLKQNPHITIKAPFETDKLEPFAEYLESLAKEIAPFKVELEGFNYFGKKVIFLDVKENSQLSKLHFRILKDVQNKFHIKPHKLEGKNVKFHSTIATGDVTEEKFDKAKQYLKKYHPKFKFTANTFGIFYYLGEDAGWIIVRRIKFGKGD